MKRGRLARFGLMLGLAGLFGCAPVPAPQVAVAPAPVAAPAAPPAPPAPLPMPPAPPPMHAAAALPPAPAIAAPPPPPAPPAMHPVARAAHPLAHHRWRRYAAARTGFYGWPCGSVVHPCSVYHADIPIQ
ncbi:MAG TPA: hypothetical protein VLX67_03095 [Stellaceae bacterium]|nr:hypothetical protein [Stellaceae bacterium]